MSRLASIYIPIRGFLEFSSLGVLHPFLQLNECVNWERQALINWSLQCVLALVTFMAGWFRHVIPILPIILTYGDIFNPSIAVELNHRRTLRWRTSTFFQMCDLASDELLALILLHLAYDPRYQWSCLDHLFEEITVKSLHSFLWLCTYIFLNRSSWKPYVWYFTSLNVAVQHWEHSFLESLVLRRTEIVKLREFVVHCSKGIFEAEHWVLNLSLTWLSFIALSWSIPLTLLFCCKSFQPIAFHFFNCLFL